MKRFYRKGPCMEKCVWAMWKNYEDGGKKENVFINSLWKKCLLSEGYEMSTGWNSFPLSFLFMCWLCFTEMQQYLQQDWTTSKSREQLFLVNMGKAGEVNWGFFSVLKQMTPSYSQIWKVKYYTVQSRNSLYYYIIYQVSKDTWCLCGNSMWKLTVSLHLWWLLRSSTSEPVNIKKTAKIKLIVISSYCAWKNSAI